MTQPPLLVQGLIKRFDDVVAVDGVDLTLGDDEILALVGPSGCGKSTLLRTIAGLLHADAGQILLDGDLVDDGATQMPPERRSCGLVFQEHALFPHLTVRDNVGFGVRGLSTADTKARIDEMLKLVSLDSHGDRFPHELSGGERQRVALARALAPRPALMLFDEPFASLDHNLRVSLRHHVVAALKATSTPAVFVTHDQREALTLGDRIAVMNHGRLVQVGTPAEVFHQPRSSFIAGFMGDASFLQLSESDGQWSTRLGPTNAPLPGKPSVAMVRPDDVQFFPAADGDAEVTTAEYHGTDWVVTVALDDGTELVVTRSHLDPVRVGDRGSVALTPGHRQVVVPTS